MSQTKNLYIDCVPCRVDVKLFADLVFIFKSHLEASWMEKMVYICLNVTFNLEVHFGISICLQAVTFSRLIMQMI